MSRPGRKANMSEIGFIFEDFHVLFEKHGKTKTGYDFFCKLFDW